MSNHGFSQIEAYNICAFQGIKVLLQKFEINKLFPPALEG